MTEQERINNFINTISNYENKYDIIEFVNKINNLLDYSIDLSFMNKLMKYVDKNECCIPHKMLSEFGVISGKNSSDTKRALNGYKMQEGKDFNVRNVAHIENDKTYYTNIYLLHPRCFKILLMRSKNTLIYAKYYLLLEDSIKYYHDYQRKCKDSEIDKLQKTMDGMRNDLVNNTKELSEVKEELTGVKEELTEVKEELIVSNEINLNTNKKLDRVCDHMAVPTDDLKDKPKFVILRTNTLPYKYYAMRNLERHVKYNIKLKKSEYPIISLNEYAPNSITMWKNIKRHELINPYIKTNRNEFELKNNITEEKFLENVKAVINERYDVE